MGDSKQPPTLEEIAKVAGVSRSTVSRVINNEPNVRPEVRERVWKVVEECGYHPNAAARSLVRRRSQILGVVIPQAVSIVFGDPFFPALLQGISDAASEHGYHLMLSMVNQGAAEKEFYRQALRGQLLDGLIISSALTDDPIIPRLIQDRTPFVVIGWDPHQAEAACVDIDNEHGAYMAVEHLIGRGRRRIAIITGPLRTTPGIDRLGGYRLALRDAGLPVDDTLIAEGDFTEAGGYAAMQQLLGARPDGVFACSDLMAVGALRALRQAGYQVPRDVALVGFDDSQMATYVDPPLTTIRQPVYTLGTTAVGLLLELIEGKAHSPVQRILSTELIERSSSGAERKN